MIILIKNIFCKYSKPNVKSEKKPFICFHFKRRIDKRRETIIIIIIRACITEERKRKVESNIYNLRRSVAESLKIWLRFGLYAGSEFLQFANSTSRIEMFRTN